MLVILRNVLIVLCHWGCCCCWLHCGLFTVLLFIAIYWNSLSSQVFLWFGNICYNVANECVGVNIAHSLPHLRNTLQCCSTTGPRPQLGGPKITNRTSNCPGGEETLFCHSKIIWIKRLYPVVLSGRYLPAILDVWYSFIKRSVLGQMKKNIWKM